MGFKTPEEELEEFLAARPAWARKLLQSDFSLTEDEYAALLHEDWQANWLDCMAEYEKLARRVPARWREYCERRKQGALASLPAAPPGRPRKDGLAEEGTLLHQSGKSYAEIAILFNNKYGPGTTTPDAIRKLLSSRKRRSKPEETGNA
jgi:hypothetical protein